MLSLNLIERHFKTRRYEALLEALSANGLELPLPLRVRLAQHPAAAVGLGLRRLVQLTHGPGTLSRAMIRELLTMQGTDGAFAGDPLATACAAAGLGAALRDHFADGECIPGLVGDESEPPTADPSAADITAAHGRALAALAAMQTRAPDGGCGFIYSDDRTAEDRALVAAFILLLLADDPGFRQAVRFAEMMDWFEQRQDQLDADTRLLWSLARLGAPGVAPGVTPSRAPAAKPSPLSGRGWSADSDRNRRPGEGSAPPPAVPQRQAPPISPTRPRRAHRAVAA